MADIKVTEKTFEPTMQYVKKAISQDLDKPFLIHKGSTRSTKTYSVLQVLCLAALQENIRQIDIIRSELSTLRKTAMLDLEEIIKSLGLYNSKMHNKTANIYTINGTDIRMVGANYSDRLKGSKRCIAFIDEADQLTEKQFDEIQQRTKYGIILAYNPVFSTKSHWIGSRAIPRASVVHSTYKDNAFLTDIQVDAIESYVPIYRTPTGEEIKDFKLEEPEGELISGSPTKWAVQGLGEHATSPNVIYPHWNVYEYPGETDGYGLDVGYTNPTALVEVCNHTREHKTDVMYVNELLYKSELTSNDILNKVNRLGISKDKPIYCDHSPGLIHMLEEEGYRVHKAKKNVDDGISTVKSYTMRISPTSKNLIKEIKNYKRSLKNGKPVKENDHLLDAMRYFQYTHNLSESPKNYKKVYKILNQLL